MHDQEGLDAQAQRGMEKVDEIEKISLYGGYRHARNFDRLGGSLPPPRINKSLQKE